LTGLQAGRTLLLLHVLGEEHDMAKRFLVTAALAAASAFALTFATPAYAEGSVKCECTKGGKGCTCPKGECKCPNCGATKHAAGAPEKKACECGKGKDCACPKEGCKCHKAAKPA
jgi:hypothetical protein